MGLVEVDSLLMGAMYDLLDFEPNRNASTVIGSFAFLVPSAVLKKNDGERITGTWGTGP